MLLKSIYYFLIIRSVNSFNIYSVNYLSNNILNNNKYLIKMKLDDNNNNDDNFPSFNDFIEKRKENEIYQQEEYEKRFDYFYKKAQNKKLDKYINKLKYKERYENIEPTSKDIKLLNIDITLNWCNVFITNMVHLDKNFPQILYQDIFDMRDFCFTNQNNNLIFYIGYFPSGMTCQDGPYYISSLSVDSIKHTMNVVNIIQNPNYLNVNSDINNLLNFKKELIALSNDCCTFFNFDNLANATNKCYYYSWLYDL